MEKLSRSQSFKKGSKTISFLVAFALIFSPILLPQEALAQSINNEEDQETTPSLTQTEELSNVSSDASTNESNQEIFNIGGSLVGSLLACAGLSSLLSSISSNITSSFDTVPVNDSGVRKITGDLLNKDCSLDAIAYGTAKFMEQEITNSVLEFVQLSFDGKPAFITDPSEFFLNVAEKEARSFIYTSGALNNIYAPYQSQVRRDLERSFIDRTGKRSFSKKSKCNLDDFLTDPDSFRKGDFNAGGWAGWLEATQNPYCNPYGLNIVTQDELDRRVDVAVDEQRVLADWGRGVRSVVDREGRVTTPGSIIATQLNKVLGQGFDQLNQADEINEIITSVIGGLTNQVFSRSGLIQN